MVRKHRHHIIPLHDGGTDDEMNLTPPISIQLHAEFHRDRWESLKQIEDYIAWRMLMGQMTASEASILAQQEGARRGGLACRGTPKSYSPKGRLAQLEGARRGGLTSKGCLRPSRSLVWKEKQRLAQLGKEPWNKGKTGIYSDETRKAISEAAKLQQQKGGTFLGKKHTEEAKQANREAHVGRVPWNVGKKLPPQSEESNHKRSIALKAVWAKRKGTAEGDKRGDAD